MFNLEILKGDNDMITKYLQLRKSDLRSKQISTEAPRCNKRFLKRPSLQKTAVY